MSVIRNRKIADIFKEAGLIEKYGTGIRRVLQGFADYDLLKPEFHEIGGGFRVIVYRREGEAVDQHTPQVTPQVRRLLALCIVPKSRVELQQELGLDDRKHLRTAYLKPAIEAGLIELTRPDKPSSRFQKYRLTAKGERMLDQATGTRA